MLPFALIFWIGILLTQQLVHLISLKQSIIISVFLIASLILLRKNKQLNIIIFSLTFGFLYSNWYAYDILKWTLPKEWEGQPLIIQGIVTSIPIIENKAQQFDFHVDKILADHAKQHPHVLMKIAWENTQKIVKVGDEWQFTARLKRIHGVASPGAFDYEALAFEKGLRASGYISASNNAIYLQHFKFSHPIDQLRQYLQIKLQQNIPDTTTSHWLYALTIGEKSGISADEWQVLRNTGTNHLMAIAGLHIGLAAGFMHFLVTFIWRRVPFLMLRIPAVEAGAYSAIAIAIIYSALAGFSLPTQRACIMLLVYLFSFIQRRSLGSWDTWSLALIIVLLLNPISVLSDSFWLSFGTLALITYGMSARVNPGGIWWNHGRVQWVIGLGLVPISIYIFHECSLLSFIVNSIAIPWLGFLVLPFCLLSILFLFFAPVCARFTLCVADKMLAGLWKLLVFFSQLPLSTWHIASPTLFIFILLCTACILLLQPIGLPGRWLSVFFLLPLVFYKSPTPKQGEIWFSLLDVGQGLSALIQTSHHTLLFDAGPKLGANDMGESVVVPYLLVNHINKLDMLVVSHEDNDHLGGVASVASEFKIHETRTSVPSKLIYLKASLCKAGEQWHWDGVNFKFLYPGPDNYGRDNDSSCVLRIDNGTQSILLPGDVEKYAEKNILKNSKNYLSSTIIVAPHHGSKTSGVKQFIESVHPSIVLFSTGYRNRYHFPNPDVVTQYVLLNAKAYTSVDAGTLSFHMLKGELFADLYRKTHSHYWSVN